MTSGIIRGNSLSFLKHEELSMTVQPDSFAIGANLLATSDPAEKKAKLTEEKSKFSISSTTISEPFKWIDLPADLLLATIFISSIGSS